ncbi:hypothetical protein GCM10023188_20210 [Pontibacter saemangeumensis]|uniref:DUF4184 family protein n=2 Tax=Pontibacter saemangeumensis TaxID=1084525 RepID=A0ABP8LPH2_9BACT
MAPDFEKFITMSAHDPHSHTWRSIFYFNLPIGLLIAFIFHLIVRDALIDNLPVFMSRRLRRFKHTDWVGYFKQHYPVVIGSVLLGAASHIFWDSFTHKGGRADDWLPFMLNSIYIGGEEVSAFYIMQRVSSLVGAYVILYAILKLPPAPVMPGQDSILPFWLTVVAVAIAVAGLKFWLGEHADRDLVYIYIAALLVGLVGASLILKRRRIRT